MGARSIVIAAGIGAALLYPLLGAGPAITSSAATQCGPSTVAIKSIRARWVDTCRTRSCAYLQGAAVLTNNCPVPIGIEVTLTGLDKSGIPVASRTGWPASVSNIAPGDYTFSVDTWLEYDPAIEQFELTVASTKTWNS